MKKLLTLVMVLILALTLAACTGRNSQQTENLKIVSLAPSSTEIVAALGKLENLVGVSDFCNYPEEVLGIEKVGNAFDVNFEKIVALQPDIVLLMNEGEVADRLRELDIQVLVLNPTTIEEIYEDILKVAEVLKVEEKGRQLVDKMKDDLNKIQKETSEDKKTVFILLDSTDFWTAGKGTFYHEVIEKSGGINIAAGETGWLVFSSEKLLELDPDVILYSWEPSEELTSLPVWQNLTAVKEGRTYLIDGDLTSRPGPRIIEGIRVIAKILKGE
ncbi:iron complex transport system substrate-binding protein [Anaerobranca californiensis DSM 14826]|jgi:iron complex transport system substrate-binding protein|uniref:Iron complex transport system substrate-binding protein n=1 Tax=Anaerobranca californiensis DSM 14826 TaxID=1120989 RepID=A0A1M6N6B4_9FIRM|nr:ABC transporter substrate-binding protein [Anaerobranca californiensis]SHJ91192.1 iron complex transport system substrate-binding protein [Anaerobranca californiensis DSM 14826]